jgi:two-component system, sensor histidine kinase and response regulator
MQPSLEKDATDSEAAVSNQQATKKRCLMLMADDSVCVQKSVNTLASQLDIDLDTAEDGQAACRLAEKSKAEGNPYDIILMDMQMPKMNGIEATKWLRQHQWEGPIVAISVFVSDEDREQFLDAGCDAFIAKPINERKLRRLIERPVKRIRRTKAVSVQDQVVSNEHEKPILRGRLLIAEDARCIQMQLGSLLRKLNLEVDVAENGQIACEKAIRSQIEGNLYDVILMDMQMPKMNGKQAARWLREHEWEGPIIAVSMHATERDREEFLNAGCDDYMSKPVNELSLRNVLSQFLHHE